MKGKNLIITSVLVLAIGVILLLLHESIHPRGIVVVGSILFMAAGIFNVMTFDGAKRKNKDGHGAFSTAFNWFTSAAAIILGLCMLIFQDTFIGLIGVMLGILIAFMAFYQLYVLAIAIRPVVLPSWLYIAPLLLAALAIFLFLQDPRETNIRTALITGIALCVYGVIGIIEGSMLGNENRKRIAMDNKGADAQTPSLDETMREKETAKTSKESTAKENVDSEK